MHTVAKSCSTDPELALPLRYDVYQLRERMRRVDTDADLDEISLSILSKVVRTNFRSIGTMREGKRAACIVSREATTR